jgi:hypothetical protein
MESKSDLEARAKRVTTGADQQHQHGSREPKAKNSDEGNTEPNNGHNDRKIDEEKRSDLATQNQNRTHTTSRKNDSFIKIPTTL